MKYLKMDPKAKAVWLRALRGQSRRGRYIQGRRRLVTDRKDGECAFCCLGVIYNELGDGFVTGKDPDGHTANFCSLNGRITPRMGTLPTVFKEQIGLGRDAENHLIEMNDEKIYGLARIADWIETNL